MINNKIMKKEKNNVVNDSDEDLDSVFDSITSSEEQKSKKVLSNKNPAFLSLKSGQTVKGILLYNRKDPANTFVSYEKAGFFFQETGYVDLGLHPRSVGVKNDPISALQWKLYSEGKEKKDEAKMKTSYKLLPVREQLVNFLVLDDSENPDNNGTVKILKYGASLNKEGQPVSAVFSKIHEACFGAKKDKIGLVKATLNKKSAIIRPLVIVVKEKGGYNDYAQTAFDDPEEHGYTPEEIDEIYEQYHDLNQYVPELKSNAEIQALLDEHWHRTDISSEDSVPDDDDFDDDQDTPPKKEPVKSGKMSTKEKLAAAKEKSSAKNEELSEMIDDLDSDDINFDD